MFSPSKEHLLKEFLSKAHTKYGDLYDYSLVDYKQSHKKIKIICKKHGIFEKTPAEHLYGSGNCKKCVQITAKYFRNTRENIIEKFKSIHGNKYSYDKFSYIGYHTKSIITCPIHGDFLQSAAGHCSHECPECSKENINKEKITTFSDFVIKAKKAHHCKYIYDEDLYKRTYDLVGIKCPKHGIFYQLGSNHLKGCGCPKCSINVSEEENNLYKIIKLYFPDVIARDRERINPLELDIFIPSLNIGIEYNGLYWHSEECGKGRNYHLNKTNLCNSKKIKLIQIFENEWILKNKVVISRLKHLMGITNKSIYARKCEVREIDSITKSKFLNKYHIQGNTNSSVNLGLFYKNRLISIMIFGKRRIALGLEHVENNYELLRFCSIFHFKVVGGASKLLKYFERKYNPISIISYADKRWSQGNVYNKLGFQHIRDSKPSYWYFKGNDYQLYHRFSFRKNILSKKLNIFDKNLSEWNNMKNNGWNRIWDCGTMVFIKEYEQTKNN